MSQQINLFNPVFRQQKKYFSSVTMAQSLGLLVIGCVVLVAESSIRMRQLKAQVAAADATLVAKQAKLAQVKVQYPPRVKNPALALQLQQVRQELVLLDAAAVTLRGGNYGDSRGFSPYFNALARQRVEGLWLTDVRIEDGGARINVEGNVLQAAMVPQFMSRLSGEPVMQGKSFSTLKINRKPAPAAGDPAAAAVSYLEFSLQSGAAAGQGAL